MGTAKLAKSTLSDLLLDLNVTSVPLILSVPYVTHFISNCHNSVIFKARNLKFCMEVHLDILLLDLTSNLTSDLTLTSTSEVKSLK